LKCPWCGDEIPYEEYINHMDTEHPKIAGKEHSRTSQDQPHIDSSTQNSMSRTTLKTLYLTILDRFVKEETDGIREYEQLLDKVNHSITIAAKAGSTGEVEIPLIQMRRQINRILQEERTHLDAINALREMLQTK
jgi:rubrerythrin